MMFGAVVLAYLIGREHGITEGIARMQCAFANGIMRGINRAMM